mmetsp:Transcript_15643/g.43140  ORF Transcript_15643/g.43140 Transcript_15643/m.43140 type:complete len:262 (-) Transcript_15643:90-875(-)
MAASNSSNSTQETDDSTTKCYYPLDSAFCDGLVCTGDHEDEVVQAFRTTHTEPGLSLGDNRGVTLDDDTRQWTIVGKPGVCGDGSYFARFSSTMTTTFAQTPRIALGVQTSHPVTLGLLVQRHNLLNRIQGGWSVLGYLKNHFGKDDETGDDDPPTNKGGRHVEAHEVGPGRSVVVLFDYGQKTVQLCVNQGSRQAVKLLDSWPDATEPLVPYIAFEAEGNVELEADSDLDDEDEHDEDNQKFQLQILNREATMQAAPDLL